MSQKTFNAVLLLSVIVPLLVATIILIVVVMVLPNLGSQTESSSQSDQLAGNKTKQQVVSPLSSETKSRVLFILGITFASSLFVFLIIVIVVVCTWARQSRRYAVSGQDYTVTDCQAYGSQDWQPTKHSEKNCVNNYAKDLSNTKKEQLESVTLAALPSPPVRTVAVTTQVAPKVSKSDNCQNLESVSGRDTFPLGQPKNYGTLGRTHLLSTADEDGYHIDNLGFEPEDADADQFLSSFDDKQSLGTVYEDGFPGGVNKSIENTQNLVEEKEVQGGATAEVESIEQDNHPQKQLSKQDSFQGLPPFKSFDRYLTLVRLDSSTSLEAYSLEEGKKIGKSIEDVDEEEEIKDIQRKEEESKNK